MPWVLSATAAEPELGLLRSLRIFSVCSVGHARATRVGGQLGVSHSRACAPRWERVRRSNHGTRRTFTVSSK